VSQQHLPRIDTQKQIELENHIEDIHKPRVTRIASQKVYHPDSYKDAVSRSIDWSKYKNPLIPEPKPERPGFVKINYLKPKKIDLQSQINPYSA